LALLVVKDIEGKVKGETIRENDKVMDFVLKDLYGKIKTEGKGNLLDKGNVLWIFWVMFFEVHMVMSQLCNVEGAKVQNIRNVEEVVMETIEAHVDFQETVTGTIKVDLEVTIVPKIICREKNSVRNPRKSNRKTKQVQRWSKI
jgi:hypothetical protein